MMSRPSGRDFLFAAAMKALPVLAMVATNKKYKQR
jgi:hypothetical protein